eukprot:scaffold21648_cov166-Isochrysis_galbana.AAC.1
MLSSASKRSSARISASSVLRLPLHPAPLIGCLLLTQKHGLPQSTAPAINKHIHFVLPARIHRAMKEGPEQLEKKNVVNKGWWVEAVVVESWWETYLPCLGLRG